MLVLEPRLRRLVYVLAFETLAILLSTLLLSALSGGPAGESLPLAGAACGIAVLWNYLFNTLFEAAERTFRLRRGLGLRMLHAAGFETGLVLAMVPLYMAWYGVGLVTAAMMEAALLGFFLVYTFAFTWAFDAVVALPRPAAGPR
ncbi:PACE efflux transporter [Poseidonocella sp. HB161398]|uniref:PACE efflux transporter n=1 Tax=Poseidonocella sp. HB161398 TaxID=2320855 RepID=UPI001108B7B1|nr:PACE efflux transporter [Poseidonocella sp. HB161398]